MQKMIYTFEELSSDLQPLAGGKGGSLAKLYQSGFPVPEGFVISASAFAEDQVAAGSLETGPGPTGFAAWQAMVSKPSRSALRR